MTLIALVILPISGGLIGFVVKHSQKYFVEQQSCLGEINGQVEETYSGHMVIRAFNREEAVEETFSRTNDRLYESAWKSQFISGLMQPIMTFVGNLGYVAVAVLGSVLAVNGTIEVGDIQAFIQYVKNFTQPITQIAQVSNMLQSAAESAWMDTISGISTEDSCVKCLAWYCRIPGCSREPLWKISVTDGWMQQMRKSSRRQKRHMRIISSGRCRAVIRWS